MRNFKILLLLIAFSSISSAEIIHNMVLVDNKNICIYSDYYYIYNKKSKKNIFNFRATNNKRYSIKYTRNQNNLFSGFVYDTKTRICKPDSWLIMGMDSKDFNFLLGLMGVFFGFSFMFFTIQTFITVGGKR